MPAGSAGMKAVHNLFMILVWNKRTTHFALKDVAIAISYQAKIAPGLGN